MPKRQFTTSFLRAALLACMLSAGAGAANGYYQAPTCFAADQGGTYNIYRGWNSRLGTWVYIVKWNDNWTCSSGMLSMCDMCYWSITGELVSGTWVPLSSQTWPGPQFGCNTTNSQSYVTTFPALSTLTPGTTYTISQYDAPWDPKRGDCSLQSDQCYERIWSYTLLCPPNPS